MLATPGGRGIGVFWWEPAVAARCGAVGYFDDDGNALPVLQVFDRFTRKMKQSSDACRTVTATPVAVSVRDCGSQH